MPTRRRPCISAWRFGGTIVDRAPHLVLLHTQSKPQIPKAFRASGSQIWLLPQSTKPFRACPWPLVQPSRPLTLVCPMGKVVSLAAEHGSAPVSGSAPALHPRQGEVQQVPPTKTPLLGCTFGIELGSSRSSWLAMRGGRGNDELSALRSRKTSQPARLGGNRGGGPGRGPSPVLSGTFEGKKGTPLAGPRGQGSSRGRSVPALRPALLCLRGAGQDLAFSCRGR